ncbi:MAG: FprA family A-type flavoprotein [Bacteroidales bacterium]|nr:FprA family A-type flavoprotein [Bacteroidales bacterium]
MNITNHLYYLGINDRKKHLFENNWPLPFGVSYNSYLIADEHTALIDTLEYGAYPNYLGRIEEILKGRDLEYLIINHMEPDHAGMTGEICRRYPNIRIIANNKAFKMIENYFGFTHNLMEAKDGDLLDLGRHKLQFVMTPWLHWPETMMTYDTADHLLFSCDAFGSFGCLDGGIFDDELDFDYYYQDEMLRYYANIVGKYSGMVQKALAKLAGVPLRYICPSHGPIWRTQPTKALGLYDKWSKHQAMEGVVIAFASMYGHTEQTADYIARKIAEQGIKHIRVYDVSKTHVSYILRDVWKYKGLVLGSCAYNGDMHPMMRQLCHELEMAAPKCKVYGLFGGYSWNGGGLKKLQTFASAMDWEEAALSADILGAPDAEKLAPCNILAQAIAAKIKE